MTEREGNYGDDADEAQITVVAMFSKVESEHAAVTQGRQQMRHRILGVDQRHRGGVEGLRQVRLRTLVFLRRIHDVYMASSHYIQRLIS